MKLYAKLTIQPDPAFTVATVIAWAMDADGTMVVMPGADPVSPFYFPSFQILDHADTVASVQATYAADIRDYFDTNILSPIYWIVSYSVPG